MKFKFYEVFSGVHIKFKFYQVFSGVPVKVCDVMNLYLYPLIFLLF